MDLEEEEEYDPLMDDEEERSLRKTPGPSSVPISRRRVSCANSWIPSTSSFRTQCRKSSTSRPISRFGRSPSITLDTSPISPRFGSFYNLGFFSGKQRNPVERFEKTVVIGKRSVDFRLKLQLSIFG